MVAKTLGDFLKQEQRKRNMTWEEIADELRVSVMTVHRWKSSARFPQEHYWSALIKFCGPEIEPFLIEGGRTRHEAYTAKRQHAGEALISPQIDTSVGALPEGALSSQSASFIASVGVPEDEPMFIEYIIPKKKIYRGWRQKEWDEKYRVYTKKVSVTVDEHPLPYFNTHGPYFSPEGPSDKGYEWGYSGAGPRELATAILADHFDEKSPRDWASKETYQAVRYRYDFKDDFVQWFPKQAWQITSEEIEAWLQDFQEREKTRVTESEYWYWNDEERWEMGWKRHQRWSRGQETGLVLRDVGGAEV